jgi:hypothetical protein
MEPEVKSELKPNDLGDAPLYCKNHPKVETRLRCNKCGEPICVRCARRTPVGFRCPQCLHNQQAVYYTATAVDHVVAAAIVLVVGTIAAYIMSLMGLIGFYGWFLAIFLGPIAGGLIAEVVHRAIGGRRGRWLSVMAVSCLVLSAAPEILWVLLAVLAMQRINLSALITLGIYLVLASGAAFARLR